MASVPIDHLCSVNSDDGISHPCSPFGLARSCCLATASGWTRGVPATVRHVVVGAAGFVLRHCGLWIASALGQSRVSTSGEGVLERDGCDLHARVVLDLLCRDGLVDLANSGSLCGHDGLRLLVRSGLI